MITILNSTAFYGEKLSDHIGHPVQYCYRYNMDTGRYDYGVECDMYNGGCGALIVDCTLDKQAALEILDALDSGVDQILGYSQV